MAPELETREQVQHYLAQIFGPTVGFQTIRCEHGWVCRQKLTPQQTATGQPIGLGNYVVNTQTGVVTAHASLDPITIGEMYDEAIRTGQPVQGYQIYPVQWRVSIQRTHESAQTIEYHVHAQSLTRPPEPSEDYQLTIDKTTFAYQPTAPLAMSVLSWAEHKSRQDGTWPTEGTFEE
ncbi:hypothetical protein AWN90_18625 [Nocardia terpenica]|uniref:Uncharacterized protein n=1 Tax=Nocardia terpenica TaxID=455432 RepID=A0A0U1YZE3_9NOCA|nr:hypothetical protein [Nocardia terpenica]KZM75401.1 hypothetical protein AWN90_18625 [Nocardia terpenica]BBE00884.1 hypothetical protein [Nocardia terpenica]